MMISIVALKKEVIYQFRNKWFEPKFISMHSGQKNLRYSVCVCIYNL